MAHQGTISGSSLKAPKRAREEDPDPYDIDFTAVDTSNVAMATGIARNRHLALECITQLSLHIRDLEARIRELERNAYEEKIPGGVWSA